MIRTQGGNGPSFAFTAENGDTGAQAAAHHVCLTVPQPLLGEADEIFQGSQPCLTVVDGRSFLVVNLCPAQARDATTWGVTQG